MSLSILFVQGVLMQMFMQQGRLSTLIRKPNDISMRGFLEQILIYLLPSLSVLQNKLIIHSTRDLKHSLVDIVMSYSIILFDLLFYQQVLLGIITPCKLNPCRKQGAI